MSCPAMRDAVRGENCYDSRGLPTHPLADCRLKAEPCTTRPICLRDRWWGFSRCLCTRCSARLSVSTALDLPHAAASRPFPAHRADRRTVACTRALVDSTRSSRQRPAQCKSIHSVVVALLCPSWPTALMCDATHLRTSRCHGRLKPPGRDISATPWSVPTDDVVTSILRTNGCQRTHALLGCRLKQTPLLASGPISRDSVAQRPDQRFGICHAWAKHV